MRAIGSSGSSDQIAWRKGRHVAFLGKSITAFADRADNVIWLAVYPGRGFHHRDDVVMGIIQGRAEQIIHSGIQDQKIAPFPPFQVNHGGNQQACIARDQATRFNLYLNIQIPHRALDQRTIFQRQRRRVV